jgi:hypothetical protein
MQSHHFEGTNLAQAFGGSASPEDDDKSVAEDANISQGEQA